MLKINAIGNLGADAIVRHHNGKQAIGFSIAHNEKFVDGDGVVNEKTIWVSCTLWRKEDTKLTQYLKRGQTVYVEGYPGVNVYRNKHSEHVGELTLMVTNIQLIGSAPSGRNGTEEARDPAATTAAPAPAPAMQPAQEEEIPFS